MVDFMPREQGTEANAESADFVAGAMSDRAEHVQRAQEGSRTEQHCRNRQRQERHHSKPEWNGRWLVDRGARTISGWSVRIDLARPIWSDSRAKMAPARCHRALRRSIGLRMSGGVRACGCLVVRSVTGASSPSDRGPRDCRRGRCCEAGQARAGRIPSRYRSAASRPRAWPTVQMLSGWTAGRKSCRVLCFAFFVCGSRTIRGRAGFHHLR